MSENTTKNTAEPWRVSEGARGEYLAITSEMGPIAHLSNWLPYAETMANAARIGRCVNAHGPDGAATLALADLEAVLCDPEGKCCIQGSDGDRAAIDAALANLRLLRG